MYKVYDSRTEEVLFKSKTHKFCVGYLNQYLSLFKEDTGFILIGEIER